MHFVTVFTRLKCCCLNSITFLCDLINIRDQLLFMKSPRSQNSRNKVHAKNIGFTVCGLGWVVGYDCSYFVGLVGLGLYVCGLSWVVGYENGPMDNSGSM